MKKHRFFLITTSLLWSSFLFMFNRAHAQSSGDEMKPGMTEFYEPVPAVVTPGKPAASSFIIAPSDAIVLFDGKDLSKWKGKDGGAAKWDVNNGAFTVKKRHRRHQYRAGV
ncbi:MAG: hypothetical protein ABIN89_28330 [Chitinophagaceae bacterium]